MARKHNMVRVRTGPSSYMEFNDADAKAYLKNHQEWTDAVQGVSVADVPEQGHATAEGDSAGEVLNSAKAAPKKPKAE